MRAIASLQLAEPVPMPGGERFAEPRHVHQLPFTHGGPPGAAYEGVNVSVGPPLWPLSECKISDGAFLAKGPAWVGL